MKEGTGSVDLLRKRIEEDALREAEAIISHAERSANELRKRYSSDAEKVRREIVGKAKTEGDVVKKRTLSGVNLETKRMSLQAREEVIAEVFSKAMAKLEKLRKEDGYRDILRDLHLEAFGALEEKDVVAVFDESDRSLADERLISEAESHLRETYGNDIRLEVSEDFHSSGGGVILRSRDGT